MKFKEPISYSLRDKLFNAVVLLLLMSGVFISCKDEDDDVLGASPSITLTSGTSSGMPGAEVSNTINFDAPEGIKSLIILKNGVLSETITSFNNQTTGSYEHKYTIEDLPEGSKVNFTYTATDRMDRTSDPKTFEVTVSSVPAKEIVEITGNVEGNATISGDVTWTSDKIYRLNGFVRVGSDRRDVSGNPVGDQQTGILTIEPGTLIIGDRESKGTLIVQRGSKIIAQ
ncbi:MAG: hypothetical protein M3421_13345, partial [Bacteroidota bacterium]|nr:hypothetical protein [Bacteroidota bacterium]